MTNSEPKRIMLMAGELSGDMHGAYLAQKLKELCPDCSLYGLGGLRMKEAGVEIISDITQKHTIGFLSNAALAFTNLPTLVSLVRKIKRLFTQYPPDVLVLIDNQGLNMFFAGMARKHGIRTVYYIAPQEWIWGTEDGARKVARTVDTVIAIFEKEGNVYREAGGQVTYVGHPLLDIIPSDLQKKDKASRNSRVISLFPGSRNAEVKSLTPHLFKLAEELYGKDDNLSFVVVVSDKRYKKYLQQQFGNASFPVMFAENNSNYEVITQSQIVIGASGTLSLECAIMQTPMIVLYRLPDLDYFFAKKVLKIEVDFISLPNIIMQEMIYPEFIQDSIDAAKISDIVFSIINDEQVYAAQLEKLEQVKRKLGSPGVLERAAAVVLQRQFQA